MQLKSSKIMNIPALLLPSEFRRFLAMPQGTLYIKPTYGDVKGLEATVSVGDIVSSRHRTLVKVVDYKSKRSHYVSDNIVKGISEYRVVINPPGLLSLNAMTTSTSTLRGYIHVVGEEDLLVIPFLAKSNISILYGQPGTGVVKVDSDVNVALKVLKILKPTIVTYKCGV